jgi:hypothetical protein
MTEGKRTSKLSFQQDSNRIGHPTNNPLLIIQTEIDYECRRPFMYDFLGR